MSTPFDDQKITLFYIDEVEKYLKEKIVPNCRYVGLDTEYPGDPLGPDLYYDVPGRSQAAFRIMKRNCDVTKAVSIGLSFWDEGYGHLASVNFVMKFGEENLATKESIEYMEKRGINLFFHKHFGITNKRFRDFLKRTNLMKNRELFWITFQGSRDFAYVLRLGAVEEYNRIRKVHHFNYMLAVFFPNYIDLKHLVASCKYFERLNYHESGLIANCTNFGIQVMKTNCPAKDDAFMSVCMYNHIRKNRFLSTHEIDLALYTNTLYNMASFPEQPDGYEPDNVQLEENAPDVDDDGEFPAL